MTHEQARHNAQPAVISADHIAQWHRDGFLHIPGFLREGQLAELVEWVEEISQLADGENDVLQHYELTADGARICRSEHLIEHHDGLRQLITGPDMLAMAKDLLGEPAVLYKEKINYKLAGGAGFAPHQDAPAYPFVATHLTCMIAVDAATETNGCLEMVPQRHGEVLPLNEQGCIREDLAATMAWQPTPVQAGDLLWFHSRAPHRSGPNTSASDRRALFCTYNAAAEGDRRSSYYETKLTRFAEETAGPTTRVSLIGDFQGTAPSAQQIAAYRSGQPHNSQPEES